MAWLPYVIFREMYLMGVREYVGLTSHQTNWRNCHVIDGAQLIPNFAGC